MTYTVLSIPTNSPELLKFLEIFQLKAQPNLYKDRMLKTMKDNWGDDLCEDQDGYIDGTVDVVEDGKLLHPFSRYLDDNLQKYITEKVGDFSLYARCWHSAPSEYELSLPYNIGTNADEFWVDLDLSLDGNFNIKSASFSYDNEDADSKYITYWKLKSSN